MDLTHALHLILVHMYVGYPLVVHGRGAPHSATYLEMGNLLDFLPNCSPASVVHFELVRFAVIFVLLMVDWAIILEKMVCHLPNIYLKLIQVDLCLEGILSIVGREIFTISEVFLWVFWSLLTLVTLI